MDDDPRSELRELTREARAAIEWLEASGLDGVPSDADADEILAMLSGAARPGQSAPGAGRGGAPVRDSEAGRRQPPPAAARPDAARAQRPDSSTAARPRAEPPPAGPVAARADAPLVSGDERKTRLRVLAERVAACTRCELHAGRKQTVFARGNPNAELVFVGEGPGADEDAQGFPFVGKAGQLLDKMIAAMGLGENDVYICNIVKCRPPNNRTPTANEMASCIPYLNEQLDLIRPKVIVALGGTALKGLLGEGEGITRARGSWKVYRGETPLMPTFHPAYVLRTPTREVRGMVWSDLQAVLKQLGRPLPKREG
jgi:DNA polymerase